VHSSPDIVTGNKKQEEMDRACITHWRDRGGENLVKALEELSIDKRLLNESYGNRI
jgi:hypothetical protein